MLPACSSLVRAAAYLTPIGLGSLLAFSSLPTGDTSGYLNFSPPKSDGSVTISVGYTFTNSSGSEQHETIQVTVPVNGPKKPNQTPPDDEQTTGEEKASLVADAIKEQAKGPDGIAGTADDLPITAAAGGDGVNIYINPSPPPGAVPGVAIDDIGVNDHSKEKDVATIGDVAGATGFGRLGLTGSVSGTPVEGGTASVSVTVGTTDYTETVGYGDSLNDVLERIRTRLVNDGRSASVAGGRLTVVLPSGNRTFGASSNDRTVDPSFTVFNL